MQSTRLLLFSLTFKALFSLPQGMQQIEGEISTYTKPNALEITSSDRGVIHWDSFSIQEEESVSFHLPSSDASVLNRVIGNLPSEILGAINSNGKVLLLNPHGVLFGEKSQINVACLIASTFDLQTELYAQNKEFSWLPTKTRGMIQHAGNIHAKRVELMADEIYVFNGSEIHSPSGEVYLGDRNLTEFLWVDEGSFISADGVETGGTVILLSSGTTEFHGLISARGKSGGFAEVSGSHLIYEGLADLQSEVGKAGTLLLDPTDITIGPATANNTTTAGFTFPLNCSTGLCPGSASATATRNTTTGGFSSSSIDITTLDGQLGAANVVIDSTAGSGGSGNITWTADYIGGPVTPTAPPFSTSNDLILRAPAGSTVSINAIVNNTLDGDVIIDTQGNVVVRSIAQNRPASWGSRDGLTQICAPNGDVTIQGATASIGSGSAQVGYRTAGAGISQTVTGPISITCQNLNLIGGPIGFHSTQVGHGAMDSQNVTSVLTIDATATICVEAAQNVNLLAAPGGAGEIASAIIGHGKRGLAAVSVLNGDISVTAGRNITLLVNPNPGAAADSISARIGHGSNGGTIATSVTAVADIFVEAGNDISFSMGANNTMHSCGIGHFTRVAVLTGDVTVISGNDIIMNGTTNVTLNNDTRMAIGNLLFFNDLGTINTSNVRVFACRDILMDTVNTEVFGIGSVNPGPNQVAIGDVEVVAGRNLTFTSNGTSGNGRIGNVWGNVANTSSGDTFVATGGNISLTGIQSMGILAYDNVYIASGDNVTLTQSGAGQLTFAGSLHPENAVITRIFANGSINASNPVAGARTVIGRAFSERASYASSLDLRAGGDIQLSSSYTTTGGGTVLLPTSGFYFIEADTELPAGALWTASGGQTNTICQVAPNLPILQSSVCQTAAVASDSPPIPSDGLGGVNFDTGPNGESVGIQTTGGNITIHSAQFDTTGATQDLTIGTGANNANIGTTSGNIQIWGTDTSADCQRGNSFNNIFLDIPLTTTGSIFISANNNFTMNAGSLIDNSAGSEPVTIIVDNQFPFPPFYGSGSFIMDGTTTIDSGGLLQIYTALQNQNLVAGMLNGNAFNPGALFEDTDQEVWCTYFCAPLPGNPFTISYKNCIEEVVNEAMPIVVQLLVNLHPYNEYPGWMENFEIRWMFEVHQMVMDDEPYLIRRRNLNFINQPKSYTAELHSLFN